MSGISRQTFFGFCHIVGLDPLLMERVLDGLVADLGISDDPDDPEEFARTRARPTDHQTSVDAALSVMPTSPTTRLMVLLYHHTRPTPEIDEPSQTFFKEHWNLSDSGIRTRRKELCDRGLMAWTGEYGRTSRGRRAERWHLTQRARCTLARYGIGDAPDGGPGGGQDSPPSPAPLPPPPTPAAPWHQLTFEEMSDIVGLA